MAQPAVARIPVHAAVSVHVNGRGRQGHRQGQRTQAERLHQGLGQAFRHRGHQIAPGQQMPQGDEVGHAQGDLRLKLKTPYRDGTTHIIMSSLEFMQRLAALVPRPRLNLIRFHGVLAPNTKLRAEIISGSKKNKSNASDTNDDVSPSPASVRI